MKTYTITTSDKSKLIFTDFMDLWDVLEQTENNNSLSILVREMTVNEFNQIVKEIATTNTLDEHHES